MAEVVENWTKKPATTITEEESFPSVVLEIKDIKLSITNNYDEILLLKVINTLRKI